ncbi:MAG: TspO/MBR family protein [Candidatus Spechtbacterales bacterium]|nr:TspO/MBR family protein [Candidatus Spechtbacterales bacterium]
MKKFFEAFGFILICQSAGFLGSFFTINNIESWYRFLNKPPFIPPDWLFGPAWLTLYTLMGISIFLIWQKRTEEGARQAFILFFVHLVLNAAWTPIFFGAQLVSAALIVIVAIFIFIIILMRLFYPIDKRATWLLAPYLVWVGFATYLNLGIYLLN